MASTPDSRQAPSDSAAQTRAVIASRSLMAAAMALPGLAATLAHAESAPEKGVIGIKDLNYQDWQPNDPNNNNSDKNGARTRVSSPSFYLLAPIGSLWSVEASGVADSVTGPTPYYHSHLSSASGGQVDYRKALDAKVTRYFERMAIGLGGTYSEEHDYTSRALSVDSRFYFDNNNTVLALGTGVSNDVVRGGGVLQGLFHDVGKHGNDFLVGITRVLTPLDVVQSNVTYAMGHGYFGEQYKAFYAGPFTDPTQFYPGTTVFSAGDVRPESRYQFAWLNRWNHYFPSLDASLHLSYRYYRDSYGIKSHTLGTEWFQPVGWGLTVVPELRVYNQSAARFYYDKNPPFLTLATDPTQSAYKSFIGSTGGLISYDERLSAYGAYTVGLKFIKEFPKDITVDLKGERYEQHGNWYLGGNGSSANLPFKAMFFQVGVSKKF